MGDKKNRDGLRSTIDPDTEGKNIGLPKRTHAIHYILYYAKKPLLQDEIKAELSRAGYDPATIKVTNRHLDSLFKGWPKSDPITVVTIDENGRYILTDEAKDRLFRGQFSEELRNILHDSDCITGYTATQESGQPSVVADFDNVETDVQEDYFEDKGYPEGSPRLSLHKRTERNSKLVKVKKRQVFSKTGKLACEVCGFDFVDEYGTLGERFAECHHNVPFMIKPGLRITKLSDLAVVCANCHRMLHRKPYHSVNELQELRISIRSSCRE